MKFKKLKAEIEELEEQAIQAVVSIYIAEPRTIRDESFQASPENFIK